MAFCELCPPVLSSHSFVLVIRGTYSISRTWLLCCATSDFAGGGVYGRMVGQVPAILLKHLRIDLLNLCKCLFMVYLKHSAQERVIARKKGLP